MHVCMYACMSTGVCQQTSVYEPLEEIVNFPELIEPG